MSTRLAAGMEIEFIVGDIGTTPSFPDMILPHHKYAPRLTEEEVHELAMKELAVLTPSTPEMRDRLQKWQKDLGAFATREFVNFLLYHQLSRPTLEIGPPPTLGKNYKEVVASFSPARPLAYRFGREQYQLGYYDNPGISEVRSNPMPFQELLPAQMLVLNTLGASATALGRQVTLLGNHISASAFTHKGEPYFIKPEEDSAPYIKTAAILQQLFEEGMLLNSSYLMQSRSRLRIGPYRDCDVRLMPGRVEYRSSLVNDFEMQWLRAGISHAVESETLPSPDTFVQPPMLILERQAHFNKAAIEDLYLYRVLEHARLDDNRRIIFSRYDPEQDYERPALNGLAGRNLCGSYPDTVTLLTAFFKHTIEVTKEGTLYCNKNALAALLEHLTPDESGGNGIDGVAGLQIEDYARITAQLSKIRIHGNAHTVQTASRINLHDRAELLERVASATLFPQLAPLAHKSIYTFLRSSRARSTL